jgi:hypothetical protein
MGRPNQLGGGLPQHENPCDHGATFDSERSKGLSCTEVRRLWPRLFGKCPKGCGYDGIAYASTEHYVMGDW